MKRERDGARIASWLFVCVLITAQQWLPENWAAEQPAWRCGVARTNTYEGRWARRLLKESEAGHSFAKGYPAYPVEVWKLGGEQLWIAQGGEVCVDYALRTS